MRHLTHPHSIVQLSLQSLHLILLVQVLRHNLLQELEADGMLIRKSYNTVPPQVDYTLTEFGAEASNKMFDLVDWLETNLGNILACQKK
ncbi:winged helix-turn-helix transcriptional regulator [Haemophilus parainfluenzae]